MIERLMNPEHLCNAPNCHKETDHIIQLKQRLCAQLSQQEKELVDQLTDAYMEQCSEFMSYAFIDGFCSSFDLLLDYYTIPGTPIALRHINNSLQNLDDLWHFIRWYPFE